MSNIQHRPLRIISVVIYLILMCFNLFSSFLESFLIASWGGASIKVDAFLIGKTIPDLLISLLLTATYVGIVPAIVRARNKGGDGVLWDLSSSIGVCMAVFALIISLLTILLTPQLIECLFPDYDSSGKEIAIHTMQIMMATVPFVVVSIVIRSAFESSQIFWPGTVPGILRSAFVILAIALLVDRLGVLAIPVGIAVSQVVSALVLFVVLVRRFMLSINLRKLKNLRIPVELRQLGLALIPISVTLGIYHIYNLIDRQMATSLPEGVISNLNYAYVLVLVPHGLLGTSLSTLIFPSISEAIAQTDRLRLRSLIIYGSRLVLLLSLPVSLLLLLNPYFPVQFAFERGQFLHDDTLVTASFLQQYGVFFVLFGFTSVLARVLAAMQSGWAMLIVGFGAVLVKIIASALLLDKLGATGLILGSGISLLSYCILSFLIIRCHIKIRILQMQDARETAVIVIAAATAFLATQAIFNVLTIGNEFWPFMLETGLFGVVYFCMLILLRSQDLKNLANRFIKRNSFNRKRAIELNEEVTSSKGQ